MRIAVLTSGGDAPGMNAAVRAVVRCATFHGYEPYIVYQGYRGLIEGKIEKAPRFSDCINSGGTLIRTSRLPEFKEIEVRQIALDKLREHGIDALFVIGGDGSYQGALKLSEMGMPCFTIPGTIDNDIASTDFTIGFDTALNTILDAVDKLRDTSGSHQRCSVIEVMGRRCGDLAIFAGISGGAEIVITRETGFNKQEVLDTLKDAHEKGKQHAIVIITEGITDVHALAKEINEYSGFGCRATVLGHVQRGGSPTGIDRVLASSLGTYAVDLFASGLKNKAVGYVNGQLVNYDIDEALKMPRKVSELYKIMKKL